MTDHFALWPFRLRLHADHVAAERNSPGAASLAAKGLGPIVPPTSLREGQTERMTPTDAVAECA
jgi:hypothetical protein